MFRRVALLIAVAASTACVQKAPGATAEQQIGQTAAIASDTVLRGTLIAAMANATTGSQTQLTLLYGSGQSARLVVGDSTLRRVGGLLAVNGRLVEVHGRLERIASQQLLTLTADSVKIIRP